MLDIYKVVIILLLCIPSSWCNFTSSKYELRPEVLSHGSENPTFCNGSEKSPSCGTIEYLGCTGNKKFYHESAINMTWFESWEYCRSLGLHLASIESCHEQIFVEIFLPPLEETTTESFWTSGTDLGREGQFMWMSNGRDVTFTNYRPGEPNNRFGSEHCLELVIKPGVIGYLWNDRNCLNKAYTLCQEDARFPNKFHDAES